jgi:predicted dehydrogenase
MNVEHCIDMLLGFKHGVTANVHLDFCQRPPSRVWELICSHGKVEIDILAGTLTRWESTIGEIHSSQESPQTPGEVQTLPETFERNDLFLEELRYFFLCVNAGEQPMPDIPTGAESVRIAQRALSKGLT